MDKYVWQWKKFYNIFKKNILLMLLLHKIRLTQNLHYDDNMRLGVNKSIIYIVEAILIIVISICITISSNT